MYGEFGQDRERDTLKALLQAANESLGLALITYKSQLPDVMIRHYADDGELWAALLPVMSRADLEVAVVSREADAFGAASGELSGLLSGLRDRQLSVRLLCAPSAFVTQEGRARLGELSRKGADIRIARQMSSDFAVIDGSYVVISGPVASKGEQAPPDTEIGPGNGTGRRLIIESPALASALVSLIDGVHATAARLDTFLCRLDPDKAESLVAILGQLNCGRKDATAARALGLSVRTYRRRVAEVLAWLDASSRFEAGVRAAELGLVWPCLAAAAQPQPPA